MSHFLRGNWAFDQKNGIIYGNGMQVAQVFGATVHNNEPNSKEAFANAGLLLHAHNLYNLLLSFSDELKATGNIALANEGYHLLHIIDNFFSNETYAL